MTGNRNQLYRLALSSLIALGASVPMIVLLAESSQASSCYVWAQTPVPNYGSHTIGAYGGRSGCAGSTTVKVELKWNRPLSPDPTLDYASGTYINVSLGVFADCLGGSHEYYINTHSGDGDSATSNPRRTAACFG